MEGGRLLGWGYPDRGDRPDNSNTQYALLGLYEAHRAGVKIEPEVWRSIREFYTRTQKADGSWSYRADVKAPSLTMTTAGLCGLLIAGMELNEGREKFMPDGSVENCGNYGDEENRPVRKALDWIGEHFPSAKDIGTYPHSDVLPASPTYYSLYGIERAGRLSGQRFFGKHDWYRVGCEFLVNNQQADGSWKGNSVDGYPILATSFALLFLSRGRTPVLISKLAYGPAGEPGLEQRPQRHPQSCGVHQPRAVQEETACLAGVRSPAPACADGHALASELLQTPIVYISGHKAFDLKPVEKQMLREYIENGGFIFAEACCGRDEFDASFRKLIDDLFDEEYRLKRLPADHPIWTASGKFAVSPATKGIPAGRDRHRLQDGADL